MPSLCKDHANSLCIPILVYVLLRGVLACALLLLGSQGQARVSSCPDVQKAFAKWRHEEVTQDSPSPNFVKSHASWTFLLGRWPAALSRGQQALWDSTGFGFQPRAWLVLYVACVRCCTGSICLPSGLAGGSPITNGLSSTTMQYGWRSSCGFLVLLLYGGWWNAKPLTQDGSHWLPCWTLGNLWLSLL